MISGNPIELVNVSACILQSYYLNISGLHIVFKEEDFVFNSTIFHAAGTDMHMVSANFKHLETLEEIDISGTKLQSFPHDHFKLKNCPHLVIMQMGGAFLYIEGEIPSKVKRVDISHNYYINNKFNLTQLDSRFTEFIARNCSLQGLAPSLDEME